MQNIVSYIIYMTAFGLSILGSWQYSIQKNKGAHKQRLIFWIVLTIVPVTILQGCRYNVGTDYQSYITLYQGFAAENETVISWYLNEPLFILFCRGVHFLFHGSNTAFFLIDAVIMNILLFRIFDYYQQYVNMPILYMCYYALCFPYFLNLERQGLAVILVWYSTKYVHEKKLWKFLICILIATLLHNTAIIGLALYFINFLGGKSAKLWKQIILAGAIIVPIGFNQILNFLGNHFVIFQKYTKFMANSTQEITISNLLYMLVLMAVLLIFRNFLKDSVIDIYWVEILCIAQLSTYVLNNYIDWGFRMSFYFEIALMYAYALFYNKLQYKSNRRLLIAFLGCMLLFNFTYKFYIQGNSEIFPYMFVWNQ